LTARLCALHSEDAASREVIQAQWSPDILALNPATFLQAGHETRQGTRLDTLALCLLYDLSQHEGMLGLMHKTGEDERVLTGETSLSVLSVLQLLHIILWCLLAWSQALLPNGDDPVERLDLCVQCALSRSRDAVRTTAILHFQRLNPPTSLQSG